MRYPVSGDVHLREEVSDIWTVKEIFFLQVYKRAFEHLRRCRTFIDLGANIGLTSLYVASLFPNFRIFAVEPHPDNYRMLVMNLNPLIRAGRCKTLEAAVWNLNTALAPGQSKPQDGYNRFRLREMEPGEHEDAIKALNMQSILELSGFNEVDLLKVDIEGAEEELFKGDLSWMKQISSIAIEFHDNSRVASRFDSIMTQNQFTIDDRDQHTVIATSERTEVQH